jgi:hypothetical protein
LPDKHFAHSIIRQMIHHEAEKRPEMQQVMDELDKVRKIKLSIYNHSISPNGL